VGGHAVIMAGAAGWRLQNRNLRHGISSPVAVLAAATQRTS
jgi:hypothetical protein